jgi:hypothetical protein
MSRVRIALILPAAALLLAGCASAHKNVTEPAAVKAPAVTASSSSAAPPPASSSAATTDTDLSGSWSGQYGGSFSGTFKLSWQQSGSKLSGRIQISNPPSDSAINGTVNGSSITFGTVGSTNVTYSGTVSGSSMSGTYKVGPEGGPWSATKNS